VPGEWWPSGVNLPVNTWYPGVLLDTSYQLTSFSGAHGAHVRPTLSPKGPPKMVASKITATQRRRSHLDATERTVGARGSDGTRPNQS